MLDQRIIQFYEKLEAGMKDPFTDDDYINLVEYSVSAGRFYQYKLVQSALQLGFMTGYNAGKKSKDASIKAKRP